MSKGPQENTARVIALAAGFFGAAALLGWRAGVFEKLATETLVALALFAAAFAAATYALDEGVRAWVNGLARARGGATKAPAKSPGRKPAAT